MKELDISRAPRGVLAAQSLVAAVAKLGDLAERHYLELKSTLDLSQKKDKEKIAKFILGAANRMPDVAAPAFEGFGVMLIGVAKDEIVGIPPVEMFDISKVVQKYLGANGPRWDILWVPIENSPNQVLMVLVEPPLAGQGPFSCRASGDSLTDGRVYIRADGETREATSGELDLLLERGKASRKLDLDFTVEVLGELAAVECDDESTIEEYIAVTRSRLVNAISRKEPRQPISGNLRGLAEIIAPFPTPNFPNLMMDPEDRPEEAYLASIDHWASRFRASWKSATNTMASGELEPAVVRVKNNTSVFLHDVELKLHLEGEVTAFDWIDRESLLKLSVLNLPSSPREWGPKQRLPDALAYDLSLNSQIRNLYPSIDTSIGYENSGSVTLTVDIGELRPRGVFESESDELVLIVTNRLIKSIHGSWEITARNHNEVFTGEIDVETAGILDVTKLARFILDLDESADD